MHDRDPWVVDELAGLRRRCHELAGGAAAANLVAVRLEDRVSALEQIRNEYLPELDALLERDKVDAAVALRLSRRGPAIAIGWIPKAIVLAVGLAAVGSFVLQLARALGGGG